jgi:hypothetical protein
VALAAVRAVVRAVALAVLAVVLAAEPVEAQEVEQEVVREVAQEEAPEVVAGVEATVHQSHRLLWQSRILVPSHSRLNRYFHSHHHNLSSMSFQCYRQFC